VDSTIQKKMFKAAFWSDITLTVNSRSLNKWNVGQLSIILVNHQTRTNENVTKQANMKIAQMQRYGLSALQARALYRHD
jgi:hypothetical protein